ncbi:MAG: hypothetical protein WAL98_14200 [Desulfatiglandaceae bacterium]
MRRTKLLEEIRMMRFEEAYYGWQKQRLTQEEAAQLLTEKVRLVDTFPPIREDFL